MSSHTAAWITASKSYPLEVKDAPTYTPGPNEILVRNRAVAINHIDGMIQKTDFHPIEYPAILGQDLAGEVAAVGSGVTRFKEGDRVLGHAVRYATQQNRDGAFQQNTILRTNLASQIPDDLSFEDACVLPVGLSTAACALFLKKNLGLQLPTLEGQPLTGEVVLIWGGSSSVGSNAIQLCALAGYEVWTIASPDNFRLLQALGATEMIDRNDEQAGGKMILKLMGRKLAGALDAIGYASTTTTIATIMQRCEGSKKIVTTLPAPADIPDDITVTQVRGDDLRDDALAKTIYEDILPKALEGASYSPVPEPMVIGKGLEKVQEGIDLLRKGVSAKKVVVTL